MTRSLSLVRGNNSRPVTPAPIVVAGGLRGVGASVIASAIAVELANAGYETLLLDGGDDARISRVIEATWPRFRLSDLDTSLDPVALRQAAGERLTVITADAAGMPSALPRQQRRLRSKQISALFEGFDVVIADAGSRASAVIDLTTDDRSRVLAVGAADPVAGASTYALVKLLRSERPRVPVWILENRESDGEGFIAWGRIAECASRFLGGAPRFAGTMPEASALGDRLANHLNGAPTTDACPSAPVISEVARQLLLPFDSPSAPSAFLSHHHQDLAHGNRPALANAASR